MTKKLISCGKPKSTPVAVIRWGTTSRQRTVTGTLVDIADIVRKNKITPPSIIVVGGVTGIRKQLNWFEQKPLFGKRIIVTRTRRQAGVLSEKLIAQGSDVIEVPTIDIVPLKADAKVKKAFSQNKYDWVFFTSQNGVKEFYELLDRAKKDSRIFAGAKICAIGSETAKSLAVMGIRADYVPGKFRSEAIVEHFNKKNISGKKVLILRAKKARNILPEGLKKNGALVTAVDLYDTRSPKGGAGKLKDILKEKVDMVTFASSSTVENFIKLAGDDYSRLLKGVKIASIGPITSKAIRKFGLKVNIEAKTYTIPELVKAIVSNEGKGKKDKG